MLLECTVGCVLALLGFLLGIGLIRLAATVVVVLVGFLSCTVVVYQVTTLAWDGWGEIVGGALLVGLAGALASLPVLPFTAFFRKK